MTEDPAIDEQDDDGYADRYGWEATGKHGDSLDDFEGDD